MKSASISYICIQIIFFVSASNTACPICFTEYEQEENLTKLPCNHFYHTHCIVSWLKLVNFTYFIRRIFIRLHGWRICFENFPWWKLNWLLLWSASYTGWIKKLLSLCSRELSANSSIILLMEISLSRTINTFFCKNWTCFLSLRFSAKASMCSFLHWSSQPTGVLCFYTAIIQ